MSGTKSWGASRTKVFDALRASQAALSAPEVARRCGLHSNTARFHLDHLVDVGAARRSTTKGDGPGRPTVVYAADEVPVAPVEQQEYKLLAEVLAGSLTATSPDPAGQARQAGAVRGAQLAESTTTSQVSATEAKTELVDMLESTGFAPEPVVADGVEQIHLRRCPFAAVAEHHGAVVCSVHLGLMQGLLDELGSDLHVPRLDPHVEPGRCVTHLQRG